MNKPDRMSDKRIAEIEAAIAEDAKFILDEDSLWLDNELLTALKAERQHSRELEADAEKTRIAVDGMDVERNKQLRKEGELRDQLKELEKGLHDAIEVVSSPVIEAQLRALLGDEK